METESSIKFSIIIPTYNRVDLIMETLDSVFQQTYTSFEIIVVDNCSTDHTAQVLKPFIDSGKIRYICHDKNYERARSRNTGIENAVGEFVTFLDSDDFLYPDCLKDAAEFIIRNPEIKFFQNLYELVNDKKEHIYSYDFPSLKNQYKAIAGGNFISCIGSFMHKDIYQTVRFNEDPKMIGSEDYEVWFQVLAKNNMSRIDTVNAAIREHPLRSVNQGAYDNLAYQRKYLMNKIKSDELLFNKFGPYLKNLETSYLLMEVVVANQLKDKKKAWSILKQIIRNDIKVFFKLRFLKILYNSIKS